MSISLDKLKALRKQAGHADAPAVAGVAPVAKPVPPQAQAMPAPSDMAGASSALRSAPIPRQQQAETSVFGWVENIQHKPQRAPDGDALRRLLATRNRALPATHTGPLDRDHGVRISQSKAIIASVTRLRDLAHSDAGAGLNQAI